MRKDLSLELQNGLSPFQIPEKFKAYLAIFNPSSCMWKAVDITPVFIYV